MIEVNEGSDGTFSIPVLDANGQPAAPSTARYRIDDAAAGTAVRAWTALTAAATLSIVLDPTTTDTTIISASNDVEAKIITLELNAGTATQWTAEILYAVRNLRFFP